MALKQPDPDPWLEQIDTTWCFVVDGYSNEEVRQFHRNLLPLTADKWGSKTDSERAEAVAKLLQFTAFSSSPYYDTAKKIRAEQPGTDTHKNLLAELLNILGDDNAAIISRAASSFIGKFKRRDSWTEFAPHLEEMFITVFKCDPDLETYRNLCRVYLPDDKLEALEKTYPPDEGNGRKWRFLVPSCDYRLVSCEQEWKESANWRLVQRLRTTLTHTGPNGMLLVRHFVSIIDSKFKGNYTVVKFLAPTGSGKSTTLVLDLTRLYQSIWLITPTNTAANLLWKTFQEIGVDCNIICGRPTSSKDENADSESLSIITYGMARKFISSGLVPALLIFDECNIECLDRDILIKMMQLDQRWKRTTKILGISASTPSDARVDIAKLATTVPIVSMDKTNDLAAVVASRPVFLLPGVKRVIRYFVANTTHRHFFETMKTRYVKEPVDINFMEQVYQHRLILKDLHSCWARPTFFATVEALHERLEDIYNESSPRAVKKLMNFICKEWKSILRKLFPGEDFPQRDQTLEHVKEYLKETDSAVNFSRNADEKLNVPLVFCAAMSDMLALRRAIIAECAPVEVLILHSETVNERLLDILSTPPTVQMRRVILSSSIAETSVTLSSVGVVIDTMIIKKDFQDPVTEVIERIKLKITGGQETQRKGRTGRTQNGVYIPLKPQLPSMRPKFPFPHNPNAAKDLRSIVLDLVVFHASRNWIMEIDPLVNQLVDLTLHKHDDIKAVLEELQDYCVLLVSKNKVYITRAGYEIYSMPCNYNVAYSIVVGARMGVFRSLMWSAGLSEDFPHGIREDDMELPMEIKKMRDLYWNTFFKLPCTYSHEKMTEMRNVAAFTLLARNERDAVSRAAIDGDNIKRAKHWIVKAERIMHKLYPDFPPNNEAKGGGTTRHERNGLVSLMAGLISARSKIVRIENLDCGIVFNGTRMGFSGIKKEDRAVGAFLTDVGFHYAIRKNGEGIPKITLTTSVPNFLAGVFGQLFTLPTNVSENPGRFTIGHVTYLTDQAQRVLVLRNRVEKLMTSSLACSTVHHPSEYHKMMDVYINRVIEAVDESADCEIPRTVYRARNMDEEAVAVRDVLSQAFGYQGMNYTLNKPKCSLKTQFRLPPLGSSAFRHMVCYVCLYRGHTYEACVRACRQPCSHRKITSCTCSTMEIIHRMKLIMDPRIYQAVVPNNGYQPQGCNYLRNLMNVPRSSLMYSAHYELYKKNGFQQCCRQCYSPFHNSQHNRCNPDDITCMICMLKHSDTNLPERCDIRYRFCEKCNMDIHLGHRCEEAKRYVYLHINPSWDMMQFRDFLDQRHPQRYVKKEAEGVGIMAGAVINPQQRIQATVTPINLSELLPSWNNNLDQPRKYFHDSTPNDHHLYSDVIHTF